jgi:hypothetical protein
MDRETFWRFPDRGAPRFDPDHLLAADAAWMRAIDETPATRYSSVRSMTHLVQLISLKPTATPVAAWSMDRVNFGFRYPTGGTPSS